MVHNLDYCVVTGLYYGVTISLVSFATGLSVVTLNIHHRGMRGRAVPPLVKRIVFGILAKILFIQLDIPEECPNHPKSKVLDSIRYLFVISYIQRHFSIFSPFSRFFQFFQIKSFDIFSIISEFSEFFLFLSSFSSFPILPVFPIFPIFEILAIFTKFFNFSIFQFFQFFSIFSIFSIFFNFFHCWRAARQLNSK